MSIALIVIASVIVAYLLGSLNFAVIFSDHFLKRDIRTLGSGNAGATNMMRNGGVKAGLLTFLCDALKGFVACQIGRIAFEYLAEDSVWLSPIVGAYLCGVVCIVGHLFPVFFGFKGGKGVATCVGIYAVCCPLALAAALTVFIFLAFTTRYVSLGSVCGAATVIVFSILLGLDNPPVCWLFTFLIGGAVIVMHHKKIRNLLNHTEMKFAVQKINTEEQK